MDRAMEKVLRRADLNFLFFLRQFEVVERYSTFRRRPDHGFIRRCLRFLII